MGRIVADAIDGRQGFRWAVVYCLFALGCRGEDPRALSYETYDSAGVEVVSVLGEVPVNDPRWEIRLTDTILILEEDLPSGTVFGRIVDLSAASQGLAVLDQVSQRVLLFSPEGSFLSGFGRAGEGPGEFGPGINSIHTQKEEILVPDFINRRIGRFSWEGVWLGSWPIDRLRGVPMRWDSDENGNLLLQARPMPVPSTTGVEIASDWPVSGDLLLRFDKRQGDYVDHIVLPAGGLVDRGDRGQVFLNLFAPEPVWDLGDSGLLVFGLNSTSTIQVQSGGSLARIIKLPGSPGPISAPEKKLARHMLSQYLRSQSVPEEAVSMAMQSLRVHDTYPLYTRILIGPGETLWFQRPRALESSMNGALLYGREGFDHRGVGSRWWEVFDSSGEFEGWVQMPEEFTPFDFAADRFWGVSTDSLGLQKILGFRIQIPAPKLGG